MIPDYRIKYYVALPMSLVCKKYPTLELRRRVIQTLLRITNAVNGFDDFNKRNVHVLFILVVIPADRWWFGKKIQHIYLRNEPIFRY